MPELVIECSGQLTCDWMSAINCKVQRPYERTTHSQECGYLNTCLDMNMS